MKVYELAKNLGVKSVFLMDKIRKEWKMPVKSHMESLSPELVKKIEAKFLAENRREAKKTSTATKKAVIKKGAKPKKTVAKKKAPSPAVALGDRPAPAVSKKTFSNVIRRRKQDQAPLQSVPSEPAEAPSQAGDSSATQKQVPPLGGVVRPDRVSVQNADSLQEGSDWSTKGTQQKEDLKKPVKRPLPEKEIQIKFHASDFRKREVIFQHKKKRSLISGDIKKTKITTPKAHKRIVKVHGEMKIDTLAKKMNVKRRELVRKLKASGASVEDVLDFDTIALIVPDFGFEAKNVQQTEQDILQNLSVAKDEKELLTQVKPPVVTIMGHVDHGKTTLLDTIRKTKVAEGEAGGITQHIGAYSITREGYSITFIDTPGHEAFTAMRARGAQATDIVVIVVSAVDGMMPQTIEAIHHVQSAKTPLIVAVNKMDAPGAQVDKVKQQMAKHGITPEDWGGEVSFIPLSALKGDGVDKLLEQIQIVAEMQELKCQLDRPAKGLVIESHLEKGRGSAVTLLIQNGTLKVGDMVVAGESSGRVRQMRNDQGQVVKSVQAGFPVKLIGLEKLPEVGDSFDVVEKEKDVRNLINIRRSQKQNASVQNPSLSMEELLLKTHAKEEDEEQELPLIIKSDVKGSLEALKFSLDKLSAESISIKILHSGVGGITESDVLLASTTGGVIVGFNVRPDSKATQVSRDKSVTIKTYSVIYELLEDVKKMMLGQLKSEVVEEEKGKAEVREIFHISKMGTVAGCYVTQGTLPRNGLIRVVRDGRLIHKSKIASLKHFKDDVKEVKNGFECGLSIENFNDVKPKDILEVYVQKEIQRTEL